MRKILLSFIVVLALFLRFFQIDKNPPSLYWDEASLGYNGFLISTSLHDEHNEYLPLDRFAAFGDYKPPGYIYAVAAAIKIFGVNEFSIRFPSALAGTLMVLVTYLIVYEWFKRPKIALLASFLIAVSPWSIHFSRAAFEAHLAALFNLLGIYFFSVSLRNKKKVILSFFFFILSFCTFNANRIIAPILLFVLIIFNWRHSFKNRIWIGISICIAVILLIPSLGFLISPESKIRLQEVSIWNNLEPLIESNSRIAIDNNAVWAKAIHNRRFAYTLDYLKHYFENFSGRFLFTHGDGNPRLNPQDMGELFPFELPLILLGIIFLIKNKEKSLFLIIAWMAIVPIPAGMAKETPHALRIISLLPSFQIISAYGFYELIYRMKKINVIKSLYVFASMLYVFGLFYFLHIYFKHFPINWSGEWQYGYKEMVQYVSERNGQYDHIFVTTALGRPYIYFALLNRYSKETFINDKTETKDTFGFYDIKKLGKIDFGFENLKQSNGKILFVGSKGESPTDFVKLKEITNLSNDTVFEISERK